MTKTMRVFVTGATGWIGTAVLRELRAAGHRVLGMAHSDASAAKLTAQAVDVLRADLRQPAPLADGVRACDATIHLAFHMDLTDWAGINAIDRAAIAVVLDAAAGTNKPFIGTSGTLLVAHPGRLALETDVEPLPSPVAVRAQAERLVVAAAERGVRSSVIRLAPTVHGAGDQGFVAMLTQLARAKGFAAWVDDGQQHWPAVHRDDAARLYLLALQGAAAGSVWHGAAEEGVTMRALAEAIGAKLGLPARSIAAAEAEAHFGWLAMVVTLDNRVSSRATREQLGWAPRELGLLDDVRAHYGPTALM